MDKQVGWLSELMAEHEDIETDAADRQCQQACDRQGPAREVGTTGYLVGTNARCQGQVRLAAK
jgi:hypothetical protein